MERGNNTDNGKQSFAIAKDSASPEDLQRDDDADDNDNSTILNGAQAITGKAVYSANQAARYAEQNGAQQEKHKVEAAAEEARELRNLAAWNAQMTTIGGVQMTNEEAQNARQHIIDNEDLYARRAVAEGRISADDEEAYKLNNRRIHELEDKIGRGTATADEKRESEQRKQSDLGRASEQDAGRYKLEQRGYKNDQANSVVSGSAASSVYGDVFQTTVTPTGDFNRATVAPAPALKSPDDIHTPPSQRVAAMGVDF